MVNYHLILTFLNKFTEHLLSTWVTLSAPVAARLLLMAEAFLALFVNILAALLASTFLSILLPVEKNECLIGHRNSN